MRRSPISVSSISSYEENRAGQNMMRKECGYIPRSRDRLMESRNQRESIRGRNQSSEQIYDRARESQTKHRDSHKHRKHNQERHAGYGDNGRKLEIDPDPSICGFTASFEENQPLTFDVSKESRHNSHYNGPISTRSERSPCGSSKESENSRIERLEKLVEVLVNNNMKTQLQSLPNQHDEINGVSTTHRSIPELIPSNTKFTTSMWINRIHEECLDRNFDERTSLNFFESQMTGIIKSWFKSVSSYDFTWPELKLLIIKTFPDNSEFAATLKLLVNREKTSDETITQYYFSKLYLCEACKVTGENAVSCLIDGLGNPFMKLDIKNYNFLTPEALYSQYLCKYPENQQNQFSHNRDIIEIDHYDAVEDIHRDEDAHKRDFVGISDEHKMSGIHSISDSHGNPNIGDDSRNISSDRNKSLKRKSIGSRNSSDKTKRCYTCNKSGHLTVDCRHAPLCYNCNKRGHIAAKCHIRSKDLQ